MLRVVCDTNILVSAFIADGPPSRVIEEASRGAMELVLPIAVLEELERILRGKLRFTGERWEAVAALLVDVAGVPVPSPPGLPEAVTGDHDDDVILACAVAHGVDVLVSGDRRHVLPVGEHRGVRILSAQALLAEMRRG